MKRKPTPKKHKEERPKNYKISLTIGWMLCATGRLGHAVPHVTMKHWDCPEIVRTALCGASYTDGGYVCDDVPLCPKCQKLIEFNRGIAPAYTLPLPFGYPF